MRMFHVWLHYWHPATSSLIQVRYHVRASRAAEARMRAREAVERDHTHAPTGARFAWAPVWETPGVAIEGQCRRRSRTGRLLR